MAPLAVGDVLIHKTIHGHYALHGVNADRSVLFYRNVIGNLDYARTVAHGMVPEGGKLWSSDWTAPYEPEPF